MLPAHSFPVAWVRRRGRRGSQSERVQVCTRLKARMGKLTHIPAQGTENCRAFVLRAVPSRVLFPWPFGYKCQRELEHQENSCSRGVSSCSQGVVGLCPSFLFSHIVKLPSPTSRVVPGLHVTNLPEPKTSGMAVCP
jgi:hypothetical protein